MPTGYTAALYDGKPQTFEEFVLTCARAMGATILLRDDPLAPVPEQLPTTSYEQRWVQEREEALAAVWAMSDEEADQAAHEQYLTEIDCRDEAIDRANARRAAYEGMLAKVHGWEPPTDEHVGLKTFMIEQLNSSILHDCDTSYYTDKVIERLTGDEWRAKEVEFRTSMLTRSRKSAAEAEEREASRQKWVDDLRASL